MAKLQQQKANKEYVCAKCGRTIKKGGQYYKIVQRFSPIKVRCSSCRPTRSELTNSEYLAWLWDLQDNLTVNYDFTTEDGKDELYSEIENMRDELQERLDNIPEQLQDGDAGTTLQERIEALDDALNDLDFLEFPDESEYVVEEYETEELNEEEIESLKEDKKQEYEYAVERYASDIEEIVGNIAE